MGLVALGDKEVRDRGVLSPTGFSLALGAVSPLLPHPACALCSSFLGHHFPILLLSQLTRHLPQEAFPPRVVPGPFHGSHRPWLHPPQHGALWIPDTASPCLALDTLPLQTGAPQAPGDWERKQQGDGHTQHWVHALPEAM